MRNMMCVSHIGVHSAGHLRSTCRWAAWRRHARPAGSWVARVVLFLRSRTQTVRPSDCQKSDLSDIRARLDMQHETLR